MDISINEVIKNVPNDWVRLTTHRLDIYEERLAKTQFLERFEELVNNGCLLYTSPSPRDATLSRMPSSA